MKIFEWNHAKNRRLQAERQVSFEEVVLAIEEGRLIQTVKHPNPSKYGEQQMFVVWIREYAFLVPFVEDRETVFLKTIIPSRKATKRYRGET